MYSEELNRRTIGRITMAGALLAVGLAAGTVPHSARAASLQILYSFCADKNSSGVCTDGAAPEAPLVFDGTGNLYGTTQGGGANNGGTVFEIAGSSHTVLYNFCSQTNCTDGEGPLAGLVMGNEGNLYGTTQNGGANSSGVAFELIKNKTTGKWGEKLLYTFCAQTNCTDGGNMVAGLVADGKGGFYGTTESGGLHSGGTVFHLTRNRSTGVWSEAVLYAFCSTAGCKDGNGPQATPLPDNAGHLYGTTENGGAHNSGTVFELTLSRGKWHERVLHSFCAETSVSNICGDGASPLAPLVFDGADALYGTTVQGGSGNPGYGTIFRLAFDSSSGKWVFARLHRFCWNQKGTCDDGAYPHDGLLLDSKGNLDGTTSSSIGLCCGSGGTAFSMTPAGSEKPLFAFCGSQCSDGSNSGSQPLAGLIKDGSGDFYGTAAEGGANNAGGAVFKLIP